MGFRLWGSAEPKPCQLSHGKGKFSEEVSRRTPAQKENDDYELERNRKRPGKKQREEALAKPRAESGPRTPPRKRRQEVSYEALGLGFRGLGV